MLEKEVCLGWYAALEDQTRFGKPTKRMLKFRLGLARNWSQELIGEGAPDRCPDLGNFLCCRTEPIKSCHQRAVKRRRNCERDRRDGRYHPASVVGATRGRFKDCLGQFFQEEWHPIGSVNDLFHDL